MKKRKALLLFFAFICPIFAEAAEITTPLPGKCEAFKPDVLRKSILFSDEIDKLARSKDYGQSSTSKSKEFWVVFSDRSDNTTYVAPRSTTPYKSLEFNEKVKIAKIVDGYALVYYEPKEQGIFPNISSMAEWKGWIPMSNLLLWDSCPTNRAGIYGKAMICVNLDEFHEDGKMLKLYSNPSDTKNYTNLSTNFTYYFVMKHQGDMVLLATQNTMNGISNKVLYGWVDRTSYVAWNQRSCLEPTWDAEDVEYFIKQGTKVNIYEDKACHSKASSLTYPINKAKEYNPDDPYRYRMKGQNLRYPILDDSNKTLWNCTSLSSTGDKSINPTDDETGDILKRNLDKLLQVNIAIVIDGTKSMEKFYPAVINAVKEVRSFFDKNYKIKVGVLIYRDKADGEYATEVFPMTNPANPKLAEFLANGGSYGIKSSPRDKSLEEALYYGIDQALDRFGFDPECSNMMFVIGDCGNSEDYPQITKSTLIQKIVEKNVTLMGFQVRNDSSSPAFTIFNNNITTLIKESLQGKFNNLSEKVGKHVNVRAVMDQKNNAFEFKNDAVEELENSLYVGSHKYVQSGVLDVAELTKQLNEAIVSVHKTIIHQIDLLGDAQNNIIRFEPSPFFDGPAMDFEFLRRRLGSKWAENLMKSNNAVSFRGYTLKNDKSSGRDYYKSVIFISQQELNTLMQRLHPLYEVSMMKGDDRRPYVETMKALIQSMLPGVTDAEMDAKGIDEIMSLISGLNAHTRMTKGPSLLDITSNKVVSPSQYQSIIAKFKRQYMKLQTIQKGSYKFIRETNGSKYYWIPTEDMP